jgi:hypothetical protein
VDLLLNGCEEIQWLHEADTGFTRVHEHACDSGAAEELLPRQCERLRYESISAWGERCEKRVGSTATQAESKFNPGVSESHPFIHPTHFDCVGEPDAGGELNAEARLLG